MTVAPAAKWSGAPQHEKQRQNMGQHRGDDLRGKDLVIYFAIQAIITRLEDFHKADFIYRWGYLIYLHEAEDEEEEDPGGSGWWGYDDEPD